MLDWIYRALLSVHRSRSKIADLVAMDPAGWAIDDYRWRHRKTDIRLWIANGAYGLNVAIGHDPGPYNSSHNERDLVLSDAERKLIWKAVAQRTVLERHHRMQIVAAKIDAAIASALSNDLAA